MLAVMSKEFIQVLLLSAEEVLDMDAEGLDVLMSGDMTWNTTGTVVTLLSDMDVDIRQLLVRMRRFQRGMLPLFHETVVPLFGLKQLLVFRPGATNIYCRASWQTEGYPIHCEYLNTDKAKI